MTKETNAVFSFGIITDTHIRAPEGDLSSPYPVNDKANDRARYAVNLLAQSQHDFFIHLGDMVHPLPHMDAYRPAAMEAHKIFLPLKPALYFVPGNHDAGDKVSDVSPAGAADQTTIKSYEDAFGASHYSFEHKGVLFIVMNSSLINGGTVEEAAQRKWLEGLLEQAKGKRIILFSHYPPFIYRSDEADHYDNYAMPGRQWLLDLAATAGVEAIISGHVHHFFLNQYKDVQLYCLPATSFTRQDYAVLFRGPPAAEFGRDDAAKFGVTTMTMHGDHHQISWHPTGGKMHGAPENMPQNMPENTPVRMALNYLQIPRLIPSLRHDWGGAIAMPANGPMEEFSRKMARNDYPILRIIQLGIKTVRLPMIDFIDPDRFTRMAILHRMGVRFVLFSAHEISLVHLEKLRACKHMIEAVELVGRDVAEIDPQKGKVMGALKDMGLAIWLSKITTSAAQIDKTKPFAHTVSTGCLVHEMPQLIEKVSARNNADRLIVQCPWQGDYMPMAMQQILDRWCECAAENLQLGLNIRLAPSNPADANTDADALAATIMAAQKLSHEHHDIAFMLDSFESFDRGYHPRLGLIDTLSNISDWYPLDHPN